MDLYTHTYQHHIFPVIGIAIYPAATFGFSITFSTVLHLGHIMVLPWYPSLAILSMTVCLSLGSPLYINVLPQSGTGQRAMGMRLIFLSTGSTSPFYKSIALFQKISRFFSECKTFIGIFGNLSV